jgi:hypothetical protein
MVSSKPRPILKTDKIEYSVLVAKYSLYEAMPEVITLGGGYVRLDDPWWQIKGLRNSGGLLYDEAKMVETLLSKLNDEGKKAIQIRLMLDREGDRHQGLDRLVNKYQRPTLFVPIDGERGEIVQRDYLKLKIVGNEIVWEEGSILEGLQLEEVSSMPML